MKIPKIFFCVMCSTGECDREISNLSNTKTKLIKNFGKEILEDHILIKSLIGYLNLAYDLITK